MNSHGGMTRAKVEAQRGLLFVVMALFSTACSPERPCGSRFGDPCPEDADGESGGGGGGGLDAGAGGNPGTAGTGGTGAGTALTPDELALVAACNGYCDALEACDSTSDCPGGGLSCADLPGLLEGYCVNESTAFWTCLTPEECNAGLPPGGCTPEATLTCSREAQCKRYCDDADKLGCGEDCLANCYATQEQLQAYPYLSGTCEDAFGYFLGCAKDVPLACVDGVAVDADMKCGREAGQAALCVYDNDPNEDPCPNLCFAGELYQCGEQSACLDSCHAQLQACGQEWTGAVICALFEGDFECDPTSGLVPAGQCAFSGC